MNKSNTLLNDEKYENTQSARKTPLMPQFSNSRRSTQRGYIDISAWLPKDINKELEEIETENVDTEIFEDDGILKPDVAFEEKTAPPKTINSDLDFKRLPEVTPAKQSVLVKPKNNFETPKPKLGLSTVLFKCSDLKTPRCEPPKTHNRVLFKTPLSAAKKQPPGISSMIKAKGSNKLFGSIQEENGAPNLSLLSIEREKDDSPQRLRVNTTEYLILSVLGKGGSSVVYQGWEPHSKTLRAIKCVNLDNSEAAKGYLNEVKLLQRLQTCKRVVKMFEFEIRNETNELIIVLEVGSDFSNKLKRFMLDNESLPVHQIYSYWIEMLHAVLEIHEQKIVHSDLKPSNFIIVEGYLKLIDFGIATTIQNDNTSIIKCVAEGSFDYISPEALNNNPHDLSSNINSPNYGKPKYKINYKSDVWSLGCILYQMVYKTKPFQHLKTPAQKILAILNPEQNVMYPTIENEVELHKFIDVIKSCLVANMYERPSVSDLIKLIKVQYS